MPKPSLLGLQIVKNLLATRAIFIGIIYDLHNFSCFKTAWWLEWFFVRVDAGDRRGGRVWGWSEGRGGVEWIIQNEVGAGDRRWRFIHGFRTRQGCVRSQESLTESERPGMEKLISIARIIQLMTSCWWSQTLRPFFLHGEQFLSTIVNYK